MRVAVVALLLVAACTPAVQPSASPAPTGSPSPTNSAPTTSPIANVGGIAELRSSVGRAPRGAAAQAQLDGVVAADTDFALRLYLRLVASEQGNLFLSPYSISTALTMTYAGARGQTAQEMAAVLGIGADQDAWHAGRNQLELSIADTSDSRPFEGDAVPLTLEATSAVFGQAEYPFKSDFLDLLAADYGAGLQTVDFVGETEAARLAINGWVAQRTRDRIEELLARGAIDELTRMVLVNAIYFKANWLNQFDPAQTAPSPFRLLDGSLRDVPMMHQTLRTNRYAQGDGWQAVQLAYWGASMTVIVPDDGRFAQVEGALDSTFLTGVAAGWREALVTLTMPKWESESSLGVIPQLQELGMHEVFDPNNADLTGIADVEQLYVSGVIHQANVTVDETGTEAAAATAVVVGTTSGRPDPEPVTLMLDRPFIYLIQDDATGEILFLGRLLEP
jgi:serpin B